MSLLTPSLAISSLQVINLHSRRLLVNGNDRAVWVDVMIGTDREDARKALVLALKEMDVRGDVRTTVEYLIKLLETEDFKKNAIDTAWLDKIIANKTVSVSVDPHVVSLSAAIYKAFSQIQSQTTDFVNALAKGQTSLSPVNSLLSFPVEITFDNHKFQYMVHRRGPNHLRLQLNGQEIDVKIRQQPDKSLLCVVNGENFQLYGQVRSPATAANSN